VSEHQRLQRKIASVNALVQEKQNTLLQVTQHLRAAESNLQAVLDGARPILNVLQLVQKRMYTHTCKAVDRPLLSHSTPLVVSRR
jgi:hypothetical protein